MVIRPGDLPEKERYKLIIGTIVPRPIAWVSTVNAAGVPNLAPFSYFTAVCTEPLTLLFCPQVKPDGRDKDTLNNIRAVPEYVINLTNEATAAAMNRSATLLPPGVSEFDYAGVTPLPSDVVRPPRVAEAPVAFECTLQQIITVNPLPGGGHAVLGTVQRIHIRDDIYVGGYVVLDALQPIGRLAGDAYTRVTDVFHLVRDRAPRT